MVRTVIENCGAHKKLRGKKLKKLVPVPVVVSYKYRYIQVFHISISRSITIMRAMRLIIRGNIRVVCHLFTNNISFASKKCCFSLCCSEHPAASCDEWIKCKYQCRYVLLKIPVDPYSYMIGHQHSTDVSTKKLRHFHATTIPAWYYRYLLLAPGRRRIRTSTVATTYR